VTNLLVIVLRINYQNNYKICCYISGNSHFWSRHASVSIVASLWYGQLWNRGHTSALHQRQWSSPHGPDLLWGPSSLLCSEYRFCFYLQGRASKRQANVSITAPCVLLTWYLFKHWVNFVILSIICGYFTRYKYNSDINLRQLWQLFPCFIVVYCTYTCVTSSCITTLIEEGKFYSYKRRWLCVGCESRKVFGKELRNIS
jgi:hypothetical protein